MNNEHLQRLLPFGYIYLVIMGIIKESIFFYQLDINILKFSSIMDILISPIAEITKHPFLLLFFIILAILLYLFKKYSLNHSEKKSIKKFYIIKENENLTQEDFIKRIDIILIGFFFALLICFFLGFGIGGGVSLSKKIKDGKLNFDKHGQTLTFNSGEKKEIYLINTNSQYYFYVVKGKKNIEISPIGTIQSLNVEN